ncbi:O-antigen ligase family protein [Candidatus Dojkabacteria bacterium]|nr:O-antigen ligase family protein [Candidatus Dojkabacteria bacterium]
MARRKARKNTKKKTTIRIPLAPFSNKAIVTTVTGISVFVLGVSLFTIPLIFISEFNYEFDFPKYCVIIFSGIILGVLFIVRTILTTKKSLLQSPIIILVITFLLTYILSSIFSLSPIVSIIGLHGKWILGLLSVICFCIITIVTANVVNPKKDLEIISWFVTLSCMLGLSAALISRYILKDDIFFIDHRLSSTEGHPIHMGIFLSLAFPLTTGLIDKYQKIYIRIFLIVILAMEIFSIILTFSRGAWLACLLGAIFFVIYLIRKTSDKRKRIGITLIAFTLLLLTFLVPKTASRLSETWKTEREENSVSIRLSEWKSTLQVFAERPLTGTGPEMLYTRLPKYREKWLNKTPDWVLNTAYTRNTYLHLLATVGVIGTLPFLGLALFIIIKLLRRMFSFDMLSFGFSVAMLIWFFNLLHYHPTPSSFLFGAVLIGITTCLLAPPKRIYTTKKIPGTLVLIVPVILSVLAFWSAGNYISAEYLFSKSLSQSPGAAISTLIETIRRNPYEQVYYRQKAYFLYTFLEENTEYVPKTETTNQIKSALKSALTLNIHDPNTYETTGNILYKLDLLYPNDKYIDQAIPYGEKAIELDPNHPVPHDSLGLYYMEAKRYNSAIKEFDKAIELKDDFWGSYLHKSEVLIQQEHYEEALEYLETVRDKSLNPLQVNLAVQRISYLKGLKSD